MCVEYGALEPNWRLRSFLDVAWIGMAQQKVKGRAVVSRVINIGGLINADNFVTGDHYLSTAVV
jgi:hypothetical protein